MTHTKRASGAAFGAAIAARKALKKDDPSAFATALSRGIALRDDVFGSTKQSL